MNFISNIWNSPRTSVAEALIAVVTIAGVLSQQGISLGKAGSAAISAGNCDCHSDAAGLLARDPDTAASQRISRSASSTDGIWARGC